MKAWLFQDPKQLRKGKDPWSVGWYDPAGNRKQKTFTEKGHAETYLRRIEGQLAAGTYEATSRATWEEFTADFESSVLAGMKPATKEATQQALNHFERVCNPKRMRQISTRLVMRYVAARRLEPAHRHTKQTIPDAPRVSVATINKELRTLRAVFSKAKKLNYLASVPEIEFLRGREKLKNYVTPEHFALIYGKCDQARWPARRSFTAGDWWRGLIMFGYMTGWRIGSMLSLRWEDVDFDKAQALSRGEFNKGGRDQLIPLHPVLVEHLQPLRSFSPTVFPWEHGRRALYGELASIVEAAGVPHYTFHDLRRAFATLNAERLTGGALQVLMQHKDYQTTQRYINMARQLKPAIQNLYVPTLPAITTASG